MKFLLLFFLCTSVVFAQENCTVEYELTDSNNGIIFEGTNEGKDFKYLDDDGSISLMAIASTIMANNKVYSSSPTEIKISNSEKKLLLKSIDLRHRYYSEYLLTLKNTDPSYLKTTEILVKNDEQKRFINSIDGKVSTNDWKRSMGQYLNYLKAIPSQYKDLLSDDNHRLCENAIAKCPCSMNWSVLRAEKMCSIDFADPVASKASEQCIYYDFKIREKSGQKIQSKSSIATPQ